MNPKLTSVIAKLAVWLFNLRFFIGIKLCEIVFFYCRAASSVIGVSQSRLAICIRELRVDLYELAPRYQTARHEASTVPRERPFVHIIAPQSVRWTRVRLEMYGIRLGSGLIETGGKIVGLSIESMGGAIAISSSQINAIKRNSESLDTILNRPPSPISGLELLLWMVTSSSHVSDTLGDFRETYELKRVKSGTDVAISWARSQVYRDVQNRIGNISMIIGWLMTGFAWFKKLLHMH